MTPSLAQIGAMVAGAFAPAAAAGPTERPGALAMPEQTAESGELVAANTRYSLDFSPGFLEGPEWPIERWLLSSFQMTLRGTIVVGSGLVLTPETETLAVTLALVQNGHPVWSKNLELKLVPELGTDKQHFNFQQGVFVDLTNPLTYVAGAQPRFVISGLIPIYKPPGPTFEEEAIARMDSLLSALEIMGVTTGEVLTAAQETASNVELATAAEEANGETLGEVVSELEAAGVSQTEMVELLQEIATNTEGEPE